MILNSKRRNKEASPNRAYLASANTSAQIPRRGTSDMLGTLGEIPYTKIGGNSYGNSYDCESNR